MTLMFTFLPYSIQKRDTLPVGHTTPNPNGKLVDVITSINQALLKLNYCYSNKHTRTSQVSYINRDLSSPRNA